MAELKNWGTGAGRAVKGLFLVWIVSSVVGLAIFLVIFVALMRL